MCSPVVRVKADGFPYFTDNGNLIVDTAFGPIDDVAALDLALRRIPGLVDHGLFLGMASLVLVAEASGVREVRRS